MKKTIAILILLFSIFTFSFCSKNDSTIIICGKIENASNSRINLIRSCVFGSKHFYTQSDSIGNFYFRVDFNDIKHYGLFVKRLNIIPLFVEPGDSIYLSFNQSELEEYHDFLMIPTYTGKGHEKNKHFYFLLKDRLDYQDTIGKLRELEDPFKYRSVFLNKLDSEEKEIIKYFRKYPDLNDLKEYAIEDNKYFWLTMAMKYHHIKKGVDIKKFPLTLDSLGYFNFIDEYAPYSVGSEYTEWFEFFINEYLLYLAFTKKGVFFFDIEAEDQVKYIMDNTNGIIQKACLARFEKLYGGSK